MTGERCDGSIRCPASEHVEGCFTGEGHPDALRALRAPSEEAHLREQLAEAVAAERQRIADELRHGNYGMGDVVGRNIRGRLADLISRGEVDR